MRFRRRPNAPPEPEGDDDTAWARPDDQAPGDEAIEEPEPPPEAAPPDEPRYEAVEESVDELPAEWAEDAVEEPGYEPVYEAVEEPVAAPEPYPVEEPAPVSSWSGGPDVVVPGAEGTVRAAGGVVWSRWQGGLRVVVVHRPRYDDWTLPKGKAGPGESDVDCALREVREETGLACSLGEDLGTTSYHDRHGRLKTVRYFAMQPLGGGESPQHEVDEVRWLALEEAKRLLSYDRDVAVLDALADMASGGAQHRQTFGPPPEP